LAGGGCPSGDHCEQQHHDEWNDESKFDGGETSIA
jgi:hypothetical protein